MANTSIVTQEMLQDTLQNYHENLVYPFLNGATHTGCVPLGTILPYFGETAPTHFLICDGTEYAKADYPELAAHLLALTDPTPYVVSGDSTKFKVPDLRGEFLRGTGTNSHTNQGSGGNIGEHQDATLHNNIYSEVAGNFTTVNIGIYPSTTNEEQATNKDSSIQAIGYGGSPLSAKAAVSIPSGGKYTSRPTNTSVLWCIAYENTYIDGSGESSGGGHKIQNDSDSAPLTQRKTLLLNEPIVASDDAEGGNTVVDVDTDVDLSVIHAPGTAGQVDGHIYSTDETVVGKWIDGRNVYEKIINFGALPNNSSKTAQSGLQNEKIIEMKCSSFSSANEWTVMIPNVDSTNPIALGYNYNNHTVVIKTITDRSAYTETYVTLKYTKTTDTV